MDKSKIIVIFHNHRTNEELDVEIPTNITATELIVGMNAAFHLEMKTDNPSVCSLKSENPIALLRGNKLIQEYGLHDGSVIHFT